MADRSEPNVVDDLFALPPGDFVAARDELVATLRASGASDEAATANALRRPTLAAWAINQVVRSHPDAWQALVTAGAQARRAHRRALSGIRQEGLREALTARRSRVEELTDLAADALTAADARPDAHLDAIAATFEQASADPAAAERVGEARLTAPLPGTSGFDLAGGLVPVPSPDPGEHADTDGDGDAGDEPEELARRRRGAIVALEAARWQAERSATSARSTRNAAQRRDAAAAAAQRDADAARERADRTAAEAARAAEDATRAADAARRAVDDARQAADDAAEAEAAAAADARAALDAADRLDAITEE